MMRSLVLFCGATALSACATVPAATPAARAAIADANGAPRGTASITQRSGALRVRVDALGFAPGTYAAHVHTTGRCDAPKFESAGGHWNPAMRQHGRANPMGAHKGDLPNIVVAANGTGTVTGDIADATFDMLFDDDGAAIIIHAAADDYQTDPTGNAGGRQACGVLTRG